MLNEIILALAPSVLEAMGTALINKIDKIRAQKQLRAIIEKHFGFLADSTLDTDAFYTLVKCTKFVEVLRNYFLMIKDNLSITEYREGIKTLIKEECPTASIQDVNEFVSKTEELYTNYLRTIIEQYPGIGAAIQLMSISHREIISKICDSREEIRRYLAALDNRKVTIGNETIQLYHSVTEKEFGTIRFTGISGAERKKAQTINEFYVENNFSYYGNKIEKLYDYDMDDIESIRLRNFFDLGNRIILIGGAGLGKTTTLNYLFCNYEKLYHSNALKLKLDLKEYADEIGLKKKGILWCIANEFKKRISYSGQTMEEIQAIVADNLIAGNCLVILDALDEIPTQALRNTVRTEIEAFTAIYYLNRFIISTREAGYLKNRFDDRFLHIRINDFNKEQIKKYSKNWYLSSHEEVESLKSFESFWEKFTAEVDRARCNRLIGNPIILVLALIIFDFESRLPNKRIEFYQKCIDTFLTEREDRKAAFQLDDKTKNILSMNLVVPKIAFYRHNKLTEEVSYRFNYRELEKAVMEAIDVEDRINWETAVKQYSCYLVERTELIQEVDEDLLDFAHKTFYEYFLAFYFAKACDNEYIINLLKDWIGDPNYDELSRLIIEIIIQNNDPKQHNHIVGFLFDLLLDNTDVSVTNKRDVFSVILDLYTHNLLHPKFHYKYNNFILYNPVFMQRFNFDIKHKRMVYIGKLYDPELISVMFFDAFKNGDLVNIIDSLRYLNNEFKNKVIALDDSGLIYHICQLFSLSGDSRSDGGIEDLEYFLTQKAEYIRSYPQIFVAVITALLKKNIECDLEGFMDYSFDPRNIFFGYMNPIMFHRFARKASRNKDWLAIFLIALIDCANKMTNNVLDFAIGYFNRREDSMSKESKFCIHLWKMLNSGESTEDFKNNLRQSDWYDPKYERIYDKVFKHYTENSKEIGADMTKQTIAEIEKES